MNIQAIMKQTQQLQKDMMKAKEEINKTEYVGKSSLVEIKVNGEKEVLNVKICIDNLENDDKEMLEDMIMLAMNEANKKVDKDTEEKMGKYTKGLPGLF